MCAPALSLRFPAIPCQRYSTVLGEIGAALVMSTWKCLPHAGLPQPDNLFSSPRTYPTSHPRVLSRRLMNSANVFSACWSDTLQANVSVQKSFHGICLTHVAYCSAVFRSTA